MKRLHDAVASQSEWLNVRHAMTRGLRLDYQPSPLNHDDRRWRSSAGCYHKAPPYHRGPNCFCPHVLPHTPSLLIDLDSTMPISLISSSPMAHQLRVSLRQNSSLPAHACSCLLIPVGTSRRSIVRWPMGVLWDRIVKPTAGHKLGWRFPGPSCPTAYFLATFARE